MDKANAQDFDSTQKAHRIELLRSGKFSDFVIECRAIPSCPPSTFKVHRTILYGKSQYFDKLIDGQFKECLEQKAIIDEEPGVIASVLWFIYTGQYPDTDGDQEEVMHMAVTAAGFFDNKMEAHIKLYDAADRFMLPSMGYYVRASLKIAIDIAQQQGFQASTGFQEILEKLFMPGSAMTDAARHIFVWGILPTIKAKDLQQFGVLPNQFLWDLYQGIDVLLQQSRHRCDECSYSFGTDGVCFIVRERDDTYHWLNCYCGLTGLCSEYCNSDATESLIARKERPALYCLRCATTKWKPIFRYSLRRRAVGLGIDIVGEVDCAQPPVRDNLTLSRS